MPSTTAQVALSALVLALVLVAVVLASVFYSQQSHKEMHMGARNAPRAEQPFVSSQQIPNGRWLVIGTGLSAAAVVLAMDAPLRASTGMREASARLGGRVLTTLQPVIPVSTTAQAFEFGAWAVDPQLHDATLQTLQALQVPTVTQYINTAASFLFVNGVFSALPPPPVLPPTDPRAAYASLDAAAAMAWFAHTGLAAADAPTAAVGALAALLLPDTCVVPAGLGWQAVVLHAIGLTPVQYGARVVQLGVRNRALTVHYAAGQVEDVQGVVLTCSAADLRGIQGVLPRVLKTLDESLVGVPQGVLIATWPAQDAWWPATGFVNALAATDTRLGHIVTIGTTTLRCMFTAVDTINSWSASIVNDGLDATAVAIANILKTIFPGAPVTPPAHITFRGWPTGLWLWTAGTAPAEAAAVMARPLGPDVPVWWTSSDIAPVFQNRVEGAITGGQAVAAAAAQYTAANKQ
jgi:hypothetical protein